MEEEGRWREPKQQHLILLQRRRKHIYDVGQSRGILEENSSLYAEIEIENRAARTGGF